MMLLLLFTLFQYGFQTMRSLCQEECEAEVSISLRSRGRNTCEADVKMNAKPIATPMRSGCQRACKADASEADVQIMRSRCHDERKADIKTNPNAKPMSR